MDGKRKRTPEEIEAIRRRKARRAREEALRGSDNNYERRVRTSKENMNHNSRRRTSSSRRVNSETLLIKEDLKILKTQRLIKRKRKEKLKCH